MANHRLVYDGCQVGSFRRSQSQLDDRSAVFPRARAVVFRTLPLMPSAPSMFHTDCDGKPLQPISTGKIHVFQPLSLQVWASSSYLLFFSSWASSTLSSHGTVSSTRITRFADFDHNTISGLRVVWATSSGNVSFFPRSTLISQSRETSTRLAVLAEVVGFASPSLTKLMKWGPALFRGLSFFRCLSRTSAIPEAPGRGAICTALVPMR